jgi:hypothetical protein
MGAMFNMKSSSLKVDGRLAASPKSVQLSVLLGGPDQCPEVVVVVCWGDADMLGICNPIFFA